MEVKIKTFEQLSASELYEILKSRFWVFVMEQQCFYLDMDNTDLKSLHLFLWDENNIEQTEQGPNPMPITAYARLFQDENRIWHIGRMLTLKRKQELGTMLMQTALQTAKKQQAQRVSIDAQCHAVEFYEKLGFQVCSEPFDEAGIKHVKMQIKL